MSTLQRSRGVEDDKVIGKSTLAGGDWMTAFFNQQMVIAG